ncbi:hypothetical protein C5167_012214 [Papaver somniferum]|uniref:Uncharacterized protein n=1 Tax=Papaver somniferum TaxID=3469 RepID=A0A4Y7IWU3_PAPSO|nr:hypothetical protein C5167_012214 [Papaver somniferum]
MFLNNEARLNSTNSLLALKETSKSALIESSNAKTPEMWKETLGLNFDIFSLLLLVYMKTMAK